MVFLTGQLKLEPPPWGLILISRRASLSFIYGISPKVSIPGGSTLIAHNETKLKQNKGSPK